MKLVTTSDQSLLGSAIINMDNLDKLSRMSKLLLTYRAITTHLLIRLLPKRKLMTLFLQMSTSKKACVWKEGTFKFFFYSSLRN